MTAWPPGDVGDAAMSNVSPFPEGNRRRPEPLEIDYPSRWANEPPGPIRWLVEDCVPRGSVVLFSGDSGLGKSLMMQQLMTATATGSDWLGYRVERCRSFGMFCEDPKDVLKWRQIDILRKYNLTHDDIEDMSAVSRIGKDNSLMDFNRKTDQGVVTALYDQIKSHINDFGCELLIFDTRAQVFNGMEIARKQVTAFVAALHALAVMMDGAVILTDHPSNTGLADGRGSSGSTAWRASVRCHMYLKRPKGYDEDDENARDERVLKTMKSNWGPALGALRVKYENGVFVREGESGAANLSTVGRLEMYNRIVAALKRLVGELDMRITPAGNGPNSFVRALQGPGNLSEYTARTLETARDTLTAEGRLVKVAGPEKRLLIRPADIVYSFEPRLV